MHRVRAGDHLTREAPEKSRELEARLRMEMRLRLFNQGDGMRPHRGSVLAEPTVVEDALNLERSEAPRSRTVQTYWESTAAGIEIDRH